MSVSLTYSEFANQTASEKVILAWIAASQRLMVWSLYSGSVYSKVVPEFVTGLIQDGTALAQVASIAAINSAGKWYFDAMTKTLYVRVTGSGDPDAVFLRGDYRIFVSNGPFDLPWDLDTGTEVEYLPILQSTSDFPYEIDPDQFGVSLEGQGSVTLDNLDGYFDSRFEKYWWENKDVVIWSWSPSILLSEKQKIYRGTLASKSFAAGGVTFNLKDFIAKLSNNVSLESFDGSEGDVAPALIGSSKRRLYGRVAGLQLVGIDSVLDGYDLTGTVSGDADSPNVTGSGTLFLDEVSPDDQIVYLDQKYRVKTVTSNTALVLSSALEDGIVAAAVNLNPKIPWRKKNRRWYVAGHPLKKISAQIVTAITQNRFTLDDPREFFEGDEILIDGEKAIIRRRSGSLIVLSQNLVATVTPGMEVSRYPVQAVNWGIKDFIFIRDFAIDNAGPAVLEMDELAEFNITRPQTVTGSMTFTNGSRDVTCSGGQLLTQVNTRDFVRPSDGSWYEVLSVTDDTNLVLRTSFAQSTVTSSGERKVMEVLADQSILTVDCFGKTEDGTEDGEWIKTGPQAVRDLLDEAGLTDDIDPVSFTEASEEAEQTLSLKLPLLYGDAKVVSIKDAIDLINQTLLGSMNYNTDFEIEYNVLNSKKPPELVQLSDDDIQSWEVVSRTDHIVREYVCAYRHLDADRIIGRPSASYQSRVNEVAERLSDAKGTLSRDIFLYEESDAQTAAQRLALYSESASSRIIIQTNLNLSTKQLADKLYVNLDRLFHRLGSEDSRLKIGLIVKVSKKGTSTEVEVEDLSGIWNKVCSIAANASQEHVDASDDERTRNGYLTDPNGIITGNDWTYRTNLIG